MPLVDTSRKVTLVKGVLSAECRTNDGKYVNSSITLDDYLGNVDGKFTWGAKGFSNTTQDVVVVDGVLTAKLKNSSNKLVDGKFDLNPYVNNNNGVLELTSVVSLLTGPPKKLDSINVAQDMMRAASSSSAQLNSASSASFSSSSAVSTSSVSTSATSVSSFSSSHFKRESKQLLIEESCTLVVLEGAILRAQCRRMDGSIVTSSFDLDRYIGNVDGRLEWDYQAFSKTSIEIALDGFSLTAKCLHYGSETNYSFSRIDLRTRLRNADGVLICIELNKKLSAMLTEVPWMKFKVIAEPDLSVFGSHPVIQETLIKIAEETVEHVTVEMHNKLTVAMHEAISAVTASAMRHVTAQIATLVQDSVGLATAHGSVSESVQLFGHKYSNHLYGRGGSNGYAYGRGTGVGINYGFGSVHSGAGEHGARQERAEAKQFREDQRTPSVANAPAVADTQMQDLIARKMDELGLAKCSSGYEFRRTESGYVCSGGGHKVTFEQLGMK